MIHRISPAALVLAAALSTAACGDNSGGNTAANESANASANTTNTATTNVVLPPAIKNSRSYRCKDNSTFHASYLADDMTVNIRDKEENPPIVVLKADAPGGEFVGKDQQGGDFKLVGSGENVTYTSPDGGAQSCRSGPAAS